MRYLLALIFSALAFLFSNGQKVIITDSMIPPGKKDYKYVGIQANLLLQQFISFNSNSSINSNPYIFSYAKNNIKTGAGFAMGTGFNVSENSSDDGVSSSHVQNANVTFRVGYEKKYFQRERFIPLWGIEFGAGVVYNKVTSRLSQSFNFNSVTVETTKVFAGPSFRGGLLVAATKHILLGTEFYFNSQLSITETSGNGNSTGGQSFVPFNIGFQAPTALFLIFRY